MIKQLPRSAETMMIAWGSILIILMTVGVPVFIVWRILSYIGGHMRRQEEESRRLRIELSKVGHELEQLRRERDRGPANAMNGDA